MPSPVKVLTVEDSQVIVERINELLKDIEGVIFLGNASSIPQAMECIKVNKPSVVILDIHLRSTDGKNGINLLNILKRLYPEITVIMLTNLADDRYKSLCKNYGADYFLDKSHDFEKIPEVLLNLRS